MTESLICRRCGHVFTLDEAERIRGNVICDVSTDGDPVCPNCRSEDYVEATECVCCGEFFAEDDTYNGCCKGCIEALATPHSVIDFCANHKDTTDVELNFATVSMLKSCGFDLNGILTDFLITASENPLLKVRFHEAAIETATRELDTEHFLLFHRNNQRKERKTQ